MNMTVPGTPRIPLSPGRLSLAAIRAALSGPIEVDFDASVWAALETRSAALLEGVRQGKAVYGLNTGFGKSMSLPAFLTHDGGLNSGVMIAQATAAALASENKSLAHPSPVALPSLVS